MVTPKAGWCYSDDMWLGHSTLHFGLVIRSFMRLQTTIASTRVCTKTTPRLGSSQTAGSFEHHDARKPPCQSAGIERGAGSQGTPGGSAGRGSMTTELLTCPTSSETSFSPFFPRASRPKTPVFGLKCRRTGEVKVAKSYADTTRIAQAARKYEKPPARHLSTVNFAALDVLSGPVQAMHPPHALSLP